MKFALISLIIFGMMAIVPQNTEEESTAESFFDFTMNNIRGQEVPMSTFEGRVLLVVNTASMCGFTKQYEELQQLHDTYSERGFAVLGFPTADFGGQEFGTDEEIAEFCEVNFRINFPLFSRISVRGNDKHDLFAYLIEQENKDFTGDIRWNFEKFLISADGTLVRRFRSNVTPLSTEITSAIEQLL